MTSRRWHHGLLAHSRLVLERWERWHRPLAILAQCAVLLSATAGAFLLRFDLIIPRGYAGHIKLALLVCLLTKPLVFHWMKLDSGWWRFVSVYDGVRLLVGNLVASAVFSTGILLLPIAGFPRSIYVLDFMLALLATAALRIGACLIVRTLASAGVPMARRVIIYGAGSAGLMLLQEFRSNLALGVTVCGFVDDKPDKRYLRLHGVRVLGGGADLPQLAPQCGIDEILIAMPSAGMEQMAGVYRHCEAAGLPFRAVPALSRLLESQSLAAQVHEIAVEDLLGRKPVRLDVETTQCLTGRVVLVTGGAGSIGSELCRQILRFRPAALVAFDTAETPLFYLQQEVCSQFPGAPFFVRVGSVQNAARLDDVCEEFHPALIYHAAAYKHVPMMESHIQEAVENNIFGTWAVAEAAERHRVERCVLVSTDKAVRPANVMGATKMVAELIMRMRPHSATTFLAVRFGNVLGSNGSVVQTFRQQIAQGGPVTITHPDMVRYFMTIPEACQLVLQSSAMGHGGDVFVLDMGQPVRILDLARKMILLSGHRAGENGTAVAFTGIRPGEKLFEELQYPDEVLRPTAHESIRVFSGSCPDPAAIVGKLERLRAACLRRDSGALAAALAALVPGWQGAEAGAGRPEAQSAGVGH